MLACVLLCVLLSLLSLTHGKRDESLHVAARNNDVAELRRLQAEGAALEAVGRDGRTPLFEAALAGAAEAFDWLVLAGADTSVRNAGGFSLIHAAAFQGQPQIMRACLALGMNPMLYHADGFLPMHRACWGTRDGHTETVRVLLEHGVPRRAKARDGTYPNMASLSEKTRALLDSWRPVPDKKDL